MSKATKLNACKSQNKCAYHHSVHAKMQTLFTLKKHAQGDKQTDIASTRPKQPKGRFGEKEKKKKYIM